VLFADVVGSMDLAAVLELERFREIMTELVERSTVVARRYGGTVEFTGDGVMAIFGAPVAMEDHAFRACLAALAIQDQIRRLAGEVERRDRVSLRMRVGLNSGQVIAGAIGSGSLGFAATGHQVGLAQRIESATPPGEVMVSESTARLVEQTATLAPPQWVRVKGTHEPVHAHRLLAVAPRDSPLNRTEANLVGRRWEMAALDAMTDRAIAGRGGLANLIGPPGIGKSRTAREAAALAAARGVEVMWTFCESHARDIPFHAVTRLLRACLRITDLDDPAARARVRDRLPDADPHDLLLLDDLLGIAHPDVARPPIDPDARRRRLTALINTASLARSTPALLIIEDAQWIDTVSESLIADFLTVVARTPSIVLITSRPEYHGTLMHLPGAQPITVGPLSDSDTATLVTQLLGIDPSVAALAVTIADRAAGNPFFAEEMVRELAQRRVLTGQRGNYTCRADSAEVNVPATVQAAIKARIDRLDPAAKRTLTTASVIGAHFGGPLLAALGVEAMFDELLGAELIERVSSDQGFEYAFRHPLIRSVAYESQLRSDRVEVHRQLAAAIQRQAPESADQNAALIAEHLRVAGDPRAAYAWHMRAGGWAIHRDIAAARLSWERARRIADALPADDADALAMRIAPRTMLCLTALRVRDSATGSFAELRELCSAAGDKTALALAMTGPAVELLFSGRAQEASRLASEQMALLESIGDPTLAVGVGCWAIAIWFDTGEIPTIVGWSQTLADLTGGDPTMGASFGIGSPLAVALASRGVSRSWLGRAGWSEDLDAAVAMVATSDAITRGAVVTYAYGWTVLYRMRRADDAAVRALEGALTVAEGSSDDAALGVVTFALAVALVCRDSPEDRQRGLALLMRVREMWRRERSLLYGLPMLDIYVAREHARRGDRDGAITAIRKAVDNLYQAGRLGYGVCGAAILVETLLERGTEADVAEAQIAIDRLANVPPDLQWAVLDVWLLRLRALMARARGNEEDYRELTNRYRVMAESLGFEGHIAMADAM